MNNPFIKYRQLVTFFAVNLVILNTTYAQETYDLSIQFEKLKTTDYSIKLELFKIEPLHENVNWETLPPLLTQTEKLTTKNNIITINNLQEGWYSLRTFQDLNENEVLDKTSSGIPKEPVGFSNNPSLFKGEPNIDKTTIFLSKDRSITIKFKHRKKRKVRKKR